MFDEKLSRIEKDVRRELFNRYPHFYKFLRLNSPFDYNDFLQDVYLELLKMGKVSSQNIVYAIRHVIRKYMRSISKQKKAKKVMLLKYYNECFDGVYKEFFDNLCKEYFDSLDLYETLHSLRNNEFVRLYLEGYTFKEIASIYGISHTTVRRRIEKFVIDFWEKAIHTPHYYLIDSLKKKYSCSNY